MGAVSGNGVTLQNFRQLNHSFYKSGIVLRSVQLHKDEGCDVEVEFFVIENGTVGFNKAALLELSHSLRNGRNRQVDDLRYGITLRPTIFLQILENSDVDFIQIQTHTRFSCLNNQTSGYNSLDYLGYQRFFSRWVSCIFSLFRKLGQVARLQPVAGLTWAGLNLGPRTPICWRTPGSNIGVGTPTCGPGLQSDDWTPTGGRSQT